MSALVSAQWLHQHLDDPNLVILDASMSTVVGMEPLTYDELFCIPGALRFDLEEDFFDHHSDQLHEMPTPQQFSTGIAKLGIDPEQQIVIYDNQGIYSAPRAWYTFLYMGFKNVKILNGGLPAWLQAGYPVNNDAPLNSLDRAQAVTHAPAEVSAQPHKLCDAQEIAADLSEERFKVIDARSSARFLAQAPEPRPGVRGGHIPHSLNLPFLQVLDHGRLKTSEQLRVIFSAMGLSENSSLVFSCGSGITACIILLAAHEAGYERLRLYDGSWAEWGSNPQLPLATDQ